jgi:hypothetical protein
MFLRLCFLIVRLKRLSGTVLDGEIELRLELAKRLPRKICADCIKTHVRRCFRGPLRSSASKLFLF